MLSDKQITELQEPFKFNEHGFLQKSPYILKSAIRNRLNRVVPGWQTAAPEIVVVDADLVVMRGALIIGDTKRYGVGTGIILRADSKGVLFDGAKLAGMKVKAYKQATSDVLPRAALEFGIGQYLKDKPKGINEDNFRGWLEGLGAPVPWNATEVKSFIAHWEIESLTLADLKKALNVTGGWHEWKGTAAEADAAVTAYIKTHLFGDAAPAGATADASR